VSCDRNASQASDDNDIFTLAQERGAVAAVSFRHLPFFPISELETRCSISSSFPFSSVV
jgi:hypothetical protein